MKKYLIFSVLSAGAWFLIRYGPTRGGMLRYWLGEEFITSAVHMAACIYWFWEANKQIYRELRGSKG